MSVKTLCAVRFDMSLGLVICSVNTHVSMSPGVTPGARFPCYG